MDNNWLNVQLNVDTTAGDFGDLAYRWLDQMSMSLAPRARLEMAPVPAEFVYSRQQPGPLGGPESLFGEVHTWHWAEGEVFEIQTQTRQASTAGMEWLRSQLAQRLPYKTMLGFWKAGQGDHPSNSLASLLVRHIERSSAWLRLEATLPEVQFLHPEHGDQYQRRYLDALWPFADQLDPGYGHVDDNFDGDSTFERCMRTPDRPRDWWDHDYSVNHCRSFLRGYSWLTIVPQELVQPLGGIQALTDSGAFAQVRPLANGGAWLLATDDYRHFDHEALHRVFRAVAPVLHPGTPTNHPRYPGGPPYRLIFQDAADAASHQ